MTPKSAEWVNASTHAVTLASGRPLAPGDRAACDMKDPHDQALRDAGHLIQADDREAKS
jgi:hypothetical protein